jgi:hypothetical protein
MAASFETLAFGERLRMRRCAFVAALSLMTDSMLSG